MIDDNQLLKIINSSIENKIPSSFIRKGDGENIFIGYGEIPGIKLRKYLRMLRIMNIRYSHISFHNYIKKELLNAFENCDYLGIAPQDHRHGYWRFEDEILINFNFSAQNKCDMNFHLEFIKQPQCNKLKSNLAECIISNRKIGVIGCYNVDNFLVNYNSRVACFIEIIKQNNKNPFKKVTVRTYQKVFELIEKSEYTDFWIVAAGIHAKIFCNYIKKKNGIAIDIGSSIDTWNGNYKTRRHLRNFYNECSDKLNE